MLSIPWIEQTNNAFVTAVQYFSTIKATILDYFDPLETLEPSDIEIAQPIVRSAVQALEVFLKWNRCLKSIAGLFYSIFHTIGTVLGAPDNAKLLEELATLVEHAQTPLCNADDEIDAD